LSTNHLALFLNFGLQPLKLQLLLGYRLLNALKISHLYKDRIRKIPNLEQLPYYLVVENKKIAANNFFALPPFMPRIFTAE
jgi:hypothetical protein